MNLELMRDGSERLHYADPALPVYIRCGDLRHFSGMAALCHWHEDVELMLALKGRLTCQVNGTPVQVEEGNAIFINQRQMHFGCSADGTDCRYLCVCFRPGLLCVNQSLYAQYVEPVAGNPALPFLLLSAGNPGHTVVLRRLAELMDVQQPMLRMAKLFALWQGLFDVSRQSVGSVPDRGQEHFRQMLNFLHANYAGRLSLDRLAAAGGVCRSRCCELFRAYTGLTPTEYVTFYRLERAMEQLRETDRMITEIADACGFGSPSYFAETFRAQKGLTPTAYRRACRS